MEFTKTLLIAAALSCFAFSASAQEVKFTFDDDQGDFGAEEISGVDTQLTLSGTGSTFTSMDSLSTATYTVSGAPLTSSFNFTATASDSHTFDVSGSGLDINGGGIDTGETLTFTFTTDILITELDFSSITATETVSVTVAGVTTTYDGTSTNDAPSVNLSLTAGQTLIFGSGGLNPAGNYDIQAFTFNVVPEPNTYALLSGFCALGFVMLRRRK